VEADPGRIIQVGERSLLVELPDLSAVHDLWRALRREPPAGAEEVIAGAESVLVALGENADVGAAARSIASATTVTGDPVRANRVAIPVMYGGPDTEDVAAISGLDAKGIVDLHAGREYMVAFVGFSPGFAYLVGGDPALRVPRLSAPRASVPAGSIGLASEFTAVYPQSTPGGWRIIGRTDMTMFDPWLPEPSLLSPGDVVTFEPAERVGAPPAWPTLRPRAAGASYVQLLDPGPMTTVQDAGRFGWGHLGVPRGGAADRRSARLANQLVGNDRTAALLESTVSGPQLRLGCDRLVAVTGARATVTVDGIPARLDTALTLPAGCELRVGPYEAGARTYVAFSGGLAVDPILGSRSTDTLSWLGPPALRAGDILPLDGEGHPAGPGERASGKVPAPRTGELVTVRATKGPRDGWVGDRGLDVLASAVFEVAATSDRTGLRLTGSAVEVERRDEMPSEGMVAGAVQIPPGGSPIVLLRNHPTTGGYPVAAVVDDDGVDALSQCRPGVRVRILIG
jgi:KipI family sensor histidine kinase inhibitor